MTKYFTVDEANRLLPLIKEKIQVLQDIKQKFERKFHELQVYKQGLADTDAASDLIFKWECDLEFMEMEAQIHVKQIHETGAQVKDIDFGLVDFPAFINGEEVLLCWRQGEDTITHYHGLHEGFAGRKPLA
ncbi:hypothetical protein DNHGIG_12580 [Collibacillus ludicampi]|uniref:DUF2203 family protein n=1 Tax=Collibacillus ludicampi TaxID=2771369 RepID=A0AAV4LDG4_9BACL|nr:DUF2203 domain-containing protein [Collibacillus ludicampi]GIM45709.1 hypothetical protein DNHGIG_12580 [Collibacillus ludicampi]